MPIAFFWPSGSRMRRLASPVTMVRSVYTPKNSQPVSSRSPRLAQAPAFSRWDTERPFWEGWGAVVYRDRPMPRKGGPCFLKHHGEPYLAIPAGVWDPRLLYLALGTTAPARRILNAHGHTSARTCFDRTMQRWCSLLAYPWGSESGEQTWDRGDVAVTRGLSLALGQACTSA